MIGNLEERLEKILNDLSLYEEDAQTEQARQQYLRITGQCSDSKIVKVQRFSPKSGAINIVPLFDIHYGLKGCNKEKLQAYIDFILKNDDYYTFLGGDTCETATKDSVGLALQEEELHTGDQRRELTDLLRPLAEKDKILFGIPGNHEMRGHRFNGDNPLIEICYDLGVPYLGFQAYLNIFVNDINYRIMGHHGTGGGRTIGAKINSASRMKNVAVSDLYVSGHSHIRAAWDESIVHIDGDKAKKERIVFVIGGSLVDYFGLYSEEGMLTPGVTGCVLITLFGDRKYISVTL